MTTPDTTAAIEAIRTASKSVACVSGTTRTQAQAILETIAAGKIPGVALWADLPCYAALKSKEDEANALRAELATAIKGWGDALADGMTMAGHHKEVCRELEVMRAALEVAMKGGGK